MDIDRTNMCSHLQRKMFEPEGEYNRLWQAMKDDSELTAVVRSRQLHIYRNGKKILILAGKSVPKVLKDDKLTEYLATTDNTNISR
ncbi:MAG: hypothetical protein ACOXZI_05270 [Candidatus Cryptobacteroides sp.]